MASFGHAIKDSDMEPIGIIIKDAMDLSSVNVTMTRRIVAEAQRARNISEFEKLVAGYQFKPEVVHSLYSKIQTALNPGKSSSSSGQSDDGENRLEGISGNQKGGLIVTPGTERVMFHAPKPVSGGSLLGLDKLAAAKRAEQAAAAAASSSKPKTRILNEWNQDGDEDSSSASSASSSASHPSQSSKHLRQHRLETPSHPGGVNQEEAERIRQRARAKVGEPEQFSSSSSSHSKRSRDQLSRSDDSSVFQKPAPVPSSSYSSSSSSSYPSSSSSRSSGSQYSSYSGAAPSPSPHSYSSSSSSYSSSQSSSKRSKWDYPTPTPGLSSSYGGPATPLLHESSRAPTPSQMDLSRLPGRISGERVDMTPSHTPLHRGGGGPSSSRQNLKPNEWEADESAMKSMMDGDEELERQWYDAEEGTAADESHNPFFTGGSSDADARLKERERLYTAGKLGGASVAKKMTARQSQALVDTEKWEENRIAQSGTGRYKEVSLEFHDEDEERVAVIVHDVKPPFLSGRVSVSKQQDFVEPVVDAACDMAQAARKGSQLLRDIREQRERFKAHKSMFRLQGTGIGNAMKVGNQDADLQGAYGVDEVLQGAGIKDEDMHGNKIGADGKVSEEDRKTKEAEMVAREMVEHKELFGKTSSVVARGEKKSGSGSSSAAAQMQFAKGAALPGQVIGDGGIRSASAEEQHSVPQLSPEFLRKKSMKESREQLPIFMCRDQLLQVIRQNNVVIIVGETGSGKTTQLTQYLYEDGYTTYGKVGCTQPRRVAATSVAKRVAEEMGVELGKEVGYSIRFEDLTSEKTIVKYMTDGVLLREALHEGDLDQYSAVIMDEAHERSLNTDVLFGVLRNIVARRRDLKLIITSATMDAGKFAAFFGNAPVFYITGRTYPVDIFFAKSPCHDYVDGAVKQAMQVHLTKPEGDILIFMTGQEDIEVTCYLLSDRIKQLGEGAPPLSILPIYSMLPSELQSKIFDRTPDQHRKCIVSTNIAETSLTVEGIKYVIDTGFCKFKVYNPRIGMDALQVYPVSRAGSNQRAGRAGRTGPGQCFRLYTETQYRTELLGNTLPEIQRTNLANVVLLLKSIGIHDLVHFGWMDPPPSDNLMNSMYHLWMLGALDAKGEITELGKKMVEFPLDPPLSKMLIMADRFGCTNEMLTIVSALSVPTIFHRPKDREEEADAVREKFFVPESDHLTFLNVYSQWKNNGGFRADWCAKHFVQYKSMCKVKEVREQLVDIMKTQQKMEVVSCGRNWDLVRKAICSAYFHHTARLKGVGEYVNLMTSMPCHLHPTSALYGMGYNPDYVCYHELVMTSKEYMQCTTAVDGHWLAELGPMLFSVKTLGGKTRSDRRREMRQDFSRVEDEMEKAAEEKRQKEELEAIITPRHTSIATPGMRPSTGSSSSSSSSFGGGVTPRRTPGRFGL